MIRRSILTLVAITCIANPFMSFAESAIPFKDVNPKAWYYKDVLQAVSEGLIKGFPDQTFNPKAYVTCGQALAAFSEAIGKDYPATALTTHWASKYSQRFYKIGGVSYEGMLDQPISRQLLFDIIDKEFKYAHTLNSRHMDEALRIFDDINTLKYHPVMNFMYAAGIVKCTGNKGTLKSNLSANITRAELCALLLRAKAFKSNPQIADDYLETAYHIKPNPFSVALSDKRIQSLKLDNATASLRDRYITALINGQSKFTLVYDIRTENLQDVLERVYHLLWTRRDLAPVPINLSMEYDQSGEIAFVEVDVIQGPVQDFYQLLSTIRDSIFPTGYETMPERERVEKINTWLLNHLTPETKNEEASHYGGMAIHTKYGYGWAYTGIQVALHRLCGLESYSVEGFARESYNYDTKTGAGITFTSVVVDGQTLYINPFWCDITRDWGNMEYFLYTKEQMETSHIFRDAFNLPQ